MPRRSAALLLLLLGFGLLWRPLLYPAGKAALLLLDVYSPALAGTDLAELITPEPRVEESRRTFGDVEMRVTFWRPAWGDTHPAVMIVNGATPVGNDNVATRRFGSSLARAGYLVMLPEFPFLKEGRLDPAAPRVVDSAFAWLRASPETAGKPAGAFGASVGAGAMLVAAGSEPALSRADFLAVLGGYFDLDTYVGSVASHRQDLPGIGVVGWEPSEEAEQRIPPAVEKAMTAEGDKALVRKAFAATSYQDALDALASLSAEGRAVVDRLSPSEVWTRAGGPPVFWIHDPEDSYEPLAEAERAKKADGQERMTLAVPRLLQHAIPSGVGERGPLFAAGELWSLLTFTLEVLRLAG